MRVPSDKNMQLYTDEKLVFENQEFLKDKYHELHKR